MDLDQAIAIELRNQGKLQTTYDKFPNVPSWIIFCTIYGSASIIAIVDNEIDLVKASEAHIIAYDEDHRMHMHVLPLTKELYHNRYCIRKEDLPEKNLYRPNTATSDFRFPVNK